MQPTQRAVVPAWAVWAIAASVTGLVTGLLAGGCGKWADELACAGESCMWTKDEWARVQSLAHPTATPPPRDTSNAYLPSDEAWLRARAGGGGGGGAGTSALDDPAVRLGWLLYHDRRLSGSLSGEDSLGRPDPSPRAGTCRGAVDVSCASCHDPARWGSDFTSLPRNVSNGAGWYDVNTQQTLNVARFSYLYWNGRSDALWAQAAQVIESLVSMNGHRMNTFWLVAGRYAAEYAAVPFAEPPAAKVQALLAKFPPRDRPATREAKDVYDTMLSDDERKTVTAVHVGAAKAIGAYEWMLSTDGSAFDRFVAAGPGSDELSPAARRGLKLFVGRASCYDCHNTPLFSDGKFHDVGVPQTGEHVPTVAECTTPRKCDCTNVDGPTCLPAGAFGGLQKLRAAVTSPLPTTSEFRRATCYDDGYAAEHGGSLAACQAAAAAGGADGGVGGGTPATPAETEPRLMGAWRTPSLRDVAKTGPYMHDGVYATLADVVWHYDTAPETGGSLGRSEIGPLHLTAQERDDLVAFLESLTGVAEPAELIAPPPAPDAGCGAPAADGGAGDAN